MNYRLFIARPLPEKYNQVIANFRAAQPKNSYRWISAENRHLTLLFIGNVESDSLKTLQQDLYTFFKERKAVLLSPKAFIYAPKPRKARMIWLRFDQSEAYNQLVIDLNLWIKQYFSNQGKSYDQPLPKKLIPHITVARFKPHDASNVSLNGQELVDQIPALPINKANLMASTRYSTGAEYKLIQSYSLGDGY